MVFRNHFRGWSLAAGQVSSGADRLTLAGRSVSFRGLRFVAVPTYAFTGQRSFNRQSTAFVMRGLRVRLPSLAPRSLVVLVGPDVISSSFRAGS
jgi:hypothetical protein